MANSFFILPVPVVNLKFQGFPAMALVHRPTKKTNIAKFIATMNKKKQTENNSPITQNNE